jgi:hypothetical protein
MRRHARASVCARARMRTHRYNNICLSAFNTFSCVQLRDNTWVMNAAPGIQCWDSTEHSVMVGVSILALIVYVAGLASFTFGTMAYAYRHDKLKDPEWLLLLGVFYRRRHPHAHARTTQAHARTHAHKLTHARTHTHTHTHKNTHKNTHTNTHTQTHT